MKSRRWFVRLGVNALPLAPVLLSSCYYHRWEEAVPRATLKLLYPVGGEDFQGPSSVLLQWESQNITSISIGISYDGGITWQTLFPKIQASQIKQTITLTQYSDNCLIRLLGVEPIGPEYVLKVPFKFSAISQPDPGPNPDPDQNSEPDENEPPQPVSLSLSTQLSGKTLLGGDSVLLEWISTSVSHINIEYSSNGGTSWNLVAGSVSASDKQYIWTVPQVFSFSSKLRISDAGGTLTDISGSFVVQKTYELSILAHNSLQTVGGYVLVSDAILGDAIVFKTAASFLVMSTICTHNGCGTQFDGSSFNCPCHGSKFDAVGKVLSGPANTPLTPLGFKYLADKDKLLIY